METEFIPKNPETLNSFDKVLNEYNRVNDTMLNFTDSYSTRIDLYVCEETTADGYGIWTIRSRDEELNLEYGVFYYEPSADAVFQAINENNYGQEDNVYTELSWQEFEEYMLKELVTNYDNYLQELEDNKEE